MQTRWALDAASGGHLFAPVAAKEAATKSVACSNVGEEVKAPPRRETLNKHTTSLCVCTLVLLFLLCGAMLLKSVEVSSNARRSSNAALRATAQHHRAQQFWAALERAVALAEKKVREAVLKNAGLKRQLAMIGAAPQVDRGPRTGWTRSGGVNANWTRLSPTSLTRLPPTSLTRSGGVNAS